MITLRAVVEVPAFDETPAWPVGAPTAGAWLALHAGGTPEEAGLFVATLADGLDMDPAGGRAEAVDAVLREDRLVVAGGLHLTDTATGVTVLPGCCAGLEDWREWTLALAGGSPWLGHDPSPEIEALDDRLRVWQDAARHTGAYVDLSRVRLAELLVGVQRDLTGFLARLDDWARSSGLGSRAGSLVAAVDRSLAVTAPLDLPPSDERPEQST
ncbi:hypothetical protein ONA91_27805 [Micromonospora sp. DR5-3]|uniref:hypothetical protein n=1 Tax=unclassified Micromonospora TaxID=2617518 RepID=UPI00210314F1|nr:MULTISPECIES: hypothetical protein [unclassified Micromonospora]MCW3818261.1 hypothetical protein [Micromonospora sp. DR5-3]